MSVDAALSEKTVRAFVDALNSQDLDSIARMLANDASYTICASDIPGAGTSRGPQIVETLNAVFSMFEDGPHAEVLNVITAGRWVVTELASRGRLRHGIDYANQYAHIYEVNGGRIRTIRVYMDTQHVADRMAQSIAADAA